MDIDDPPVALSLGLGMFFQPEQGLLGIRPAYPDDVPPDFIDRELRSDSSRHLYADSQNPRPSRIGENESESGGAVGFCILCRNSPAIRLSSAFRELDFPAQMRDLSFMHIFGQRVEVPGALIIDGGSGYCKFGWSKYHCPSGRSATFLEFGSIESPMTSKLKPFYLTICNRMQVKTSTQPIVVSLPLCHYDDTESAKGSRRQLKNAIYTTLFDMNVPAVCAINQPPLATLALFAAKHTSGIVVNVGFNQTSIVPILRGKVMYKVGVEVVGMGALKLTGFLRDRMQQNNIHFDSLYTVRTLKENLCYVALDYEAELSKDTEASFAVPSDTWFSLSKERFQTGEILFQPRMAGVQAMGLHQAVALCMDHCHDAELPGDDNWFKTVVLAGGTASLPGLAARLEKELYGLLPAFMSDGIRVIPPPYGADSAWFGAKLISNDEQLSKILVHDEKAIPALAQKLMW
ncbi:Actin-like protein arp8 [Orobanche gracilis]